MDNIIINRDGDFKDEIISSVPIGINNIIIDNDDKKFDLKKSEINNIKPMLSNNSNSISMPDNKKVKIKPMLNKKVPLNTFSLIANSKKNIGDNTSNENSDISNDSYDSNNTDSDEILSNNSRNISNNQNNFDDNDNSDEDDDYSSVENTKSKTKNSKRSYSEEEDDYSDVDDNNNNESYEDDDEDQGDDDESIDNTKKKSVKEKSYEEIQKEKQKLLFNLERLQKQGYPPSKKYSMASSYEDMTFEHDRLKKQRDVEKSIKFSRKILMALVSGVEFLNGKFDPFDVRLEGWSENIMENVSDYDEVFEELHDKYSDSVKMAPELKLLAMVAGSGFMFHLTNSLFKSASPKLSDILKQNPDIMRNISEAAVKNMGNNISQEFGQNDVIGNMMKSGINMKMNQNKGPSGPQQKMNGPSGIDDILNELNGGRDDMSVSSNESITIRSSAKRTKAGKKGGIQLDLR